MRLGSLYGNAEAVGLYAVTIRVIFPVLPFGADQTMALIP
jgi:hypothetical protein